MIISYLLRQLKDFAMPRYCDICQTLLMETEETFCASCLTQIMANNQLNDDQSLTARLFWGTVPIVRGGVLFDYNPSSPVSEVLTDIKYRGHIATCHRLGRALATFYLPRGFFEGIDLIVPIPLHANRFRHRGFNQSEEIARGIEELTRIPVRSDCLRRIVDNPTQTHLEHAERMRNTEGIFKAEASPSLGGRHVLLVDDIITTGATSKSALQTLAASLPHATFSVIAVGRGNTNKLTDPRF